MSPGDVPEVQPDSRTWASLAHLTPLVGIGVLGPLVIYLIKRQADPFVADHAREALNFQLLVLTALLVSTALVAAGIGIVIIAGVAVVVVAAVFGILGGVAAIKGESYRYPVSLRLVTGG